MYLWLEKLGNIFYPTGYLYPPQQKKNDEEQNDDDRTEPETDLSGYFSTHAQLTRKKREELIRNPFITTPDDFVADDDGRGMDDADNVQPAKQAFQAGRQILPTSLFCWYISQSFIGYQACALISQNWLINRACSLKGRDAVRNGFKLQFDEGREVPPDLNERIEAIDKKFGLKKMLVKADKMKNVFGISHVLFRVNSTDPDYYEKPFNPDGIEPGRYNGMIHIDPYWVSPLLSTDAVAEPASHGFYEPTFWVISGKKYHRSHFIILRGSEVPDILKPSYLYGGLPLTQLIAERVYAAERTANEAPQLALTKRLIIRYIENLEKAVANQEEFEQAMMALAEWRDNFGVYVESSANRVEQQDTSLSDFDTVMMSQYQIVAGQASMPATKLLGTSPKGFQSTGEHEIKNYHEELESIQENDLEPIVNRHHLCVMRSSIAPTLADKKPLTVTVKWHPLAVQSGKEKAETDELKSRTYKTLQDTGAIDEYDIRDSIIDDEESLLSGIESVPRPEDLIELEPPAATQPPAGGFFGAESADEETAAEEEPPTEPEPTGDYVEKNGSQWFVFSKEGKKLSRGYQSRKRATSRLAEIEHFKDEQ